VELFWGCIHHSGYHYNQRKFLASYPKAFDSNMSSLVGMEEKACLPVFKLTNAQLTMQQFSGRALA
jgi:hypothetical protein